MVDNREIENDIADLERDITEYLQIADLHIKYIIEARKRIEELEKDL